LSPLLFIDTPPIETSDRVASHASRHIRDLYDEFDLINLPKCSNMCELIVKPV